MAFDPKCLELANHFLAEYPRHDNGHKDDLAHAIQEAVEDWIEENKAELEPNEDEDEIE